MRSRSTTIAIAVSIALAGGAVASYLQARKLRDEAQWLMARGDAQAQQYAATFDNTAAEQQLSTFEKRRLVLEHAQKWQLLQMVLVMASVLSAFSSYVLFLFRRLREQLLDASDSSTAGIDLSPPPPKNKGDGHGPKAIAAV